MLGAIIQVYTPRELAEMEQYLGLCWALAGGSLTFLGFCFCNATKGGWYSEIVRRHRSLGARCSLEECKGRIPEVSQGKRGVMRIMSSKKRLGSLPWLGQSNQALINSSSTDLCSYNEHFLFLCECTVRIVSVWVEGKQREPKEKCFLSVQRKFDKELWSAMMIGIIPSYIWATIKCPRKKVERHVLE